MSAINIGNITNATFKVGGADCSIYLGSVKLYPQEEPPTPPFTGKYKFTLSDSSVVSAECDATSAITTADTSAYNATVTDVIIGDCVTTLGNWSGKIFQGCPNLTSVTIGSGVTSMANNTFSGCSNLTNLTINCSLSGWTSAFNGCSGVTNLTIGSGVTSAKSTLYAEMSISSVTDNSSSILATDETIPFVGYDKHGILKVYKINGNPTKIGNNKFKECSGLTSVNIPDSVTSIGGQAFRYCSSLTSITIPSGVTSIGEYAFWDCSSLTSITIPSGVTSIEGHVFTSCSSLTSVTIPNGVTSIGNSAFMGCSSLASVTIPSGVTSIEQLAFDYCSGLTSVTVEATTPPTLGDFAFASSACPLFVPSESLEDYKTAWTDYTDRLQPIV